MIPLRGWVVVACVLLAFAGAAMAQEHGGHNHPPADVALHEQFYSTWRRPDNRAASCCNNEDCYPTEARRRAGFWEAKRREDSEWVRVPPQKIEQERDNPDGRNHVCMTEPDEHNNSHVYCFLPGGGT